jgi:hypothetical protein
MYMQYHKFIVTIRNIFEPKRRDVSGEWPVLHNVRHTEHTMKQVSRLVSLIIRRPMSISLGITVVHLTAARREGQEVYLMA